MSVTVQFVSLLAMIGSGIVAGAFMDMISTGITNAGKTSLIRRKAIWIEGIAWLLAGGFAFAVLFVFRDGAWRMYDPFAQLSGLLLYAAIFHKPFRLVGRIIVIVLLRPIFLFIRFIVWGIRTGMQLIIGSLLFVLRPFRFIYLRLFRYPFKKTQK